MLLSITALWGDKVLLRQTHRFNFLAVDFRQVFLGFASICEVDNHIRNLLERLNMVTLVPSV